MSNIVILVLIYYTNTHTHTHTQSELYTHFGSDILLPVREGTAVRHYFQTDK